MNMRIESIVRSFLNDHYRNNKVSFKNKEISSDTFEKVLKDALNKQVELTPQEKLAIDGLLLTEEEIILLKSFLD